MKHLYATLISILLFAAPIRAQFTTLYWYLQKVNLKIDKYHNYTLAGNIQSHIDFPLGARVDLGVYYPSSYITQLDSNYNLKWFHSFGPNYVSRFFTSDVVVDDNGDAYYTSFLELPAELNDTTYAFPLGASSGILLAKYNTSGKLIWYKTAIADNSPSYQFKIGIDAANNIYHLAYTQYAFHFPGGDTILATTDMPATVITKLDSGGNVIWTHALYGKKLLADMKVDSSGHIAITGSCQGPQLVGTDTIPVIGNIPFVYKCDSAANSLWFRTMSGKPGNIGSAVAHLPDSSVAIIGCITDTMFTDTAATPTTPNGNSKIFLNKYRYSGSPDSAHVTGENLNYGHVNRNIYANMSGDIVVVASYAGDTSVKIDTNIISPVRPISSIVTQLDTNFHYKCHVSAALSVEPQVAFDERNNLYISGKTLTEDEGIYFSMSDTAFSIYGTFIYLLSVDATCRFKDIRLFSTPLISIGETPHITLQHQLSIVPNPAHNLVQVNCSTITGPTTTSVYSIDGRHLLTSHSLHPSTLLATSTLPSGTYIVRMTNKETSATGTFIKQ